jgi:hypothetical protein
MPDAIRIPADEMDRYKESYRRAPEGAQGNWVHYRAQHVGRGQGYAPYHCPWDDMIAVDHDRHWWKDEGRE